MKGVRFHLEYPDKKSRRAGKHSGNVFAAFVGNGRNHMGGLDGMGAVFEYANSPVASTGCDAGWLKLTKRIAEAEARRVHPRLFGAL